MDWNMIQAIGTCFGALGAIAALGFLAWQTRSLIKQTASLAEQTKTVSATYDFDSQWRRHNKSSDLALFYAQSILPRISYCSYIIEQTDIYPRLKSIDPKLMVRFNRSELEKVLGKNEDVYELVKKSVAGVDLRFFLRARCLIPTDHRDEIAERLSLQGKPDTSKEKLWHAAFEDEFWVVTRAALNDLEYFSMCINSRVADGDILYPSLHQTFFSVISAFYFLIAYQNTSMKDKYYTHIIKLFTDWKLRLLEHERREHQAEDEMSQEYHQVP